MREWTRYAHLLQRASLTTLRSLLRTASQFAKQRSDTTFVIDFDNQLNWLVGDMRPFSTSPVSFFHFMATTTGNEDFTAGYQPLAQMKKTMVSTHPVRVLILCN